MVNLRKVKLILAIVIVTVFVFAFSAGSVFAVAADYLFIDLQYDIPSGTFSILGAEQSVAADDGIFIKDEGEFIISLIDIKTGSVVVSNGFNVTRTGFMDVFPRKDDTENAGQHGELNQYSIILPLPLTQSYEISNLTIRISEVKNNTIYLEKKLADITFEVRSMDKFAISKVLPSIIPVPADPFPKDLGTGGINIWYIVFGIVLLVTMGLIVALLVWRKNRNNQSTPLPLSVSPAPTVPEPPSVPDVAPPSSETNAQENK